MPRLILFNTSYDDTSEDALAAIRKGVTVKDGLTLPTETERIADPELWPRNPPVRFRKTVPDCWIKLVIREGRNRLVCWSVGDWTTGGAAGVA
jgi:23S rRNA pseudouridine2457 synthase